MHTSVFVARAKEKHGGKFDYSRWFVTTERSQSTIICREHGDFQASPRTHLYANHGGCVGCLTEAFRDDFLAQAKTKFGQKFDYNNFKYVNAKSPSQISCPEHGPFEQCPDKHLNSKYGCPSCATIKRSVPRTGAPCANLKTRITATEFQARFSAKHGSAYQLDMSAYEKLTTSKVVLSCPTHGKTTYTAAALLMSSYACRKCGLAATIAAKVKPYEAFVEDALIAHKGMYSYPAANKAEYVNRKSWVTVICPLHGAFRKKAQKHLAGQGCWKCKVDEMVAAGKLTGYGPTFFEDNPEACSAPAVLYYLKVGSAYKVGITTNLPSRLRSIKSLSGKEVTLLDSVALTLKQAYDQEQAILKRCSEFRTYRRWTTEVFSKDVLGSSLS